MLLTNQKTINYEKFIQKYEETTPRFFDGAKIIQIFA